MTNKGNNCKMVNLSFYKKEKVKGKEEELTMKYRDEMEQKERTEK